MSYACRQNKWIHKNFQNLNTDILKYKDIEGTSILLQKLALLLGSPN